MSDSSHETIIFWSLTAAWLTRESGTLEYYQKPWLWGILNHPGRLTPGSFSMGQLDKRNKFQPQS